MPYGHVCKQTPLQFPFLTCSLYGKNFGWNLFSPLLRNGPPHKNILQSKNMSLYTVHFARQKQNLILNIYLVIARNVILENLPPLAGKFPHGVQCPPTCKFYMYPTTHSILNPVPSRTWILENVAILKFPLIRGEISPWGPKPPLTLRIQLMNMHAKTPIQLLYLVQAVGSIEKIDD